MTEESCPACGCQYPYDWGLQLNELPPISGFYMSGQKYGHGCGGCPECGVIWDRATGKILHQRRLFHWGVVARASLANPLERGIR